MPLGLAALREGRQGEPRFPSTALPALGRFVVLAWLHVFLSGFACCTTGASRYALEDSQLEMIPLTAWQHAPAMNCPKMTYRRA